MSPTEYAEKARSTAIYNAPVYYPALGLCGECGELIDKLDSMFSYTWVADIAREMGDVLWYIANLCADVNLCFLEICSVENCHPSNFSESQAIMVSDDTRSAETKLSVYSGRIAEIVKKVVRDSAGVLSSEKRQLISYSLQEIVICLIEIATDCSINMDDVAQTNIDKLMSRKERGKIQGSGDNR